MTTTAADTVWSSPQGANAVPMWQRNEAIAIRTQKQISIIGSRQFIELSTNQGPIFIFLPFDTSPDDTVLSSVPDARRSHGLPCQRPKVNESALADIAGRPPEWFERDLNMDLPCCAMEFGRARQPRLRPLHLFHVELP